MWCQCSVKTELHHQRLSVGELLLKAPIKRHLNKQVFAQNPFYDLQMLVRIICLTIGLLSCYLTRWSTIHLSIWPWCTTELSIRIHRISIVESLLLFLGAFFEKHFSQNIFLFLVRVIILHVVVMRLVEYAVGIVIAVWVFISYSSRLTYWVRIYSAYDVVWAASVYRVLSILTVRALACDQQYSLVKSANNGYFRWLLRWLCWLWSYLLTLTLALALWLASGFLRRTLRLLSRCILRILRRGYVLCGLFCFGRMLLLRRLFTFTVLSWTT